MSKIGKCEDCVYDRVHSPLCVTCGDYGQDYFKADDIVSSCSNCTQLRTDLAVANKLLRNRTKDEINALIEKYGDPQYKTSEFALYDVILIAQQLQTQLTTMEIDITGTYNRGYIDGHKDAPKPNPDICQVCGANIKGMEHSCR